MLQLHEKYMYRCIELAQKGAGATAPNPMVGAVLVHENRVIGEGFHRQYGKAHAEVNCINSVKTENSPLIPFSTLYVSLEPCAHFGKTPPCADLIIRNKIQKVVIGCRDPFKEVNGRGIEKLRAAGIPVETGILEEQCQDLNKRFFCFHNHHRPYIILKWAQSANHKIGSAGKRILISNEFSNRLVHQWRSEEAAILVGTRTALADDPSLTVRLWKGPNPIRLVADRQNKLPSGLKLFDDKAATIVFNHELNQEQDGVLHVAIDRGKNFTQELAAAAHRLNILSILVEGGATVLQSFIDKALWDEARIITNENIQIDEGVAAPVLHHAQQVKSFQLFSDRISIFKKTVKQ